LVGVGFEDGDNENENGEITDAQGSDEPGEGNQVNRRLFENVPGARLLVRTPVSAGRVNSSRPNDLLSIVIASMLSNAKSDEAKKQSWLERLAAKKEEKPEQQAAEKEERRERQQREQEIREREQRREDRQQAQDQEAWQTNIMLMLALNSSFNPAAATAAAAAMAPLVQQPQNEQPQPPQPQNDAN
jgi:hypothetical protein